MSCHPCGQAGRAGGGKSGLGGWRCGSLPGAHALKPRSPRLSRLAQYPSPRLQHSQARRQLIHLLSLILHRRHRALRLGLHLLLVLLSLLVLQLAHVVRCVVPAAAGSRAEAAAAGAVLWRRRLRATKAQAAGAAAALLWRRMELAPKRA